MEVLETAATMPGECRTVCDLCKGNLGSLKHVHIEGWLQDHKDRCEFLGRVGVDMSSICCICKACNTNIMRATKAYMEGALPSDYKPRWCKGRFEKVVCSIPCCTTEARVANHPFTWEVICNCVGVAAVQEPPALPLCQAHYAYMHRLCKPERSGGVVCKVCGVKRKHEHKEMTSQRFLPCPEPQKVEAYLREALDADSFFGGDLVCYSCYRYCQQILTSEACTFSSEVIIKNLVDKQKHLESIISTFTPKSSDCYVELALLRTSLYVCKSVLSDRAVLFPVVYKRFCSYLSNTSQSTSSVSKARVLSFLGNEFGCLVSSVCSHKKIGTMFFRTKSDPYELLSHALSEQSASIADSTSVTTCADEYSNYINGEVHKLARYLLTEAYKDETLTKAVDVDKFLEHICSVSPHLWEHICSLTRTINERKGRKAAVSEDSFSGRIKRVCRAYLLSVILFATNPECSYPFHIPLADAVESCGGSSELITILNRIGATASLPTLNRH